MKLTFKRSGIRLYFLAEAKRYMIKITYFTIDGTTEDTAVLGIIDCN